MTPISRDPLSHATCPRASRRCSRQLGRRSATGRSSSPATASTPTPRAGQPGDRRGRPLLRRWLDDNGLEAEGNHGFIPGSWPLTQADLDQFKHHLEIANILGMGHMGTGNDPTSSAYKADWDVAAEQVEPLRRDRPPRRAQAVHAQPRRRLQLPARQRPARRAGPAHPLVGHPQAGVLPADHRPEARLPRDGHLLGARGAVQVQAPTPPPTAPSQTDIFDPLGHGRERRPGGTRCSTPRTERSTPRPATATTWCRSAQVDIDYATFFKGVGRQGLPQPDVRAGQRAGRHAPTPASRCEFAELSYDNMAALTTA